MNIELAIAYFLGPGRITLGASKGSVSAQRLLLIENRSNNKAHRLENGFLGGYILDR